MDRPIEAVTSKVNFGPDFVIHHIWRQVYFAIRVATQISPMTRFNVVTIIVVNLFKLPLLPSIIIAGKIHRPVLISSELSIMKRAQGSAAVLFSSCIG